MLKYKDRDPVETVKMLYDIFTEQLGQKINLDVYYCSGFYSTKLRLGNTRFCSEGKGITRTYSIASAFGEMVERVFNLVPYRLSTSVVYDNVMNNSLINEVDDAVYREYFQEFIKELNVKDQFVDEFFSQINCKGFHTNKVTKFKQMNAVHDKKIPTRLIDLLYGTNGMSAGNSKYEAMAQALCEIIERHIVVKLLSNNIKLYNITEVIGTSTQYKEFINSINDTDYIINLYQVESDFGVYIYVLTISHESVENMICKIGIHPIKEYAIQRTFSELVQNQSIENVISTILKSKDIHNYTSISNLKRIFKDNTGFFSKKLLDNMTSNKPLDYTYNSYQEVCHHICNYFSTQGYSILWTEIMYKEIHIFQVIIPKFSEVINPQLFAEDEMKINTSFYELIENLKNIDDLTIANYREIRKMLNEYPNAINILRSLYNSECSRNQNISWINYQKNMILYCKMKESKKINGYIDDKDDEFDINKMKCQLPEVCTNCEFKNECLTFRDEKLLFENLRLLLEQVVL